MAATSVYTSAGDGRSGARARPPLVPSRLPQKRARRASPAPSPPGSPAEHRVGAARRPALGHASGSSESGRRRPPAPHPAEGRRRAQPRPAGGRLREGRRPDRREDDRADRAEHRRPATPKWSTARARSSCPASSPRTITSTRPCSGASSRTAFSRARRGRRKAMRSVVQSIWTAGRIAEPGTRGNPSKVIWDLGRVPYDPEDLLHRGARAPV